MSIALNGDGIISGVSSISNPSDITVGTGASVFSPAANTLALGTNGSERVRVNSSGNVGIGTDNPFGKLQVRPGANANFSFSTASSEASLEIINDAGSANVPLNVRASEYKIKIQGTEKVSITSGGNVQIANGNLVFSTAGTGIDFSADSNAAGMTSELLDDYEEGSWTPTIIGSSSAGTSTVASVSGTYTKVGNVCTVRFWVRWSGHTGTGDMRVTGLPFTSSSVGGSGYAGHGSGWIGSGGAVSGFPANFGDMHCVVGQSATVGAFVVTETSGYTRGLAMIAACDAAWTIVYLTA